MASKVEDRGDDAVSGDEKCTRNSYARNDSLGINSLVSRVRVVAKPCSTLNADLDLPTDSTRPGDVVSDTATAYDSKTYTSTQTPTKGEVQWTGRAKSYAADGTPSWQKVSTTDYDALGRPTVTKNTNDLSVSSITYTPKTTGPLTSTVTTDAKGFATTSNLDFATGAALKITDPNNKVTESEYDSLGRVTKVWLPNRLKVLGKTPNYVYDYKVTSGAMSWVSTGTLNGDGSGYNTSYTFYDSLLRTRQTQSPSPQGGRLISLALYDTRGSRSASSRTSGTAPPVRYPPLRARRKGRRRPRPTPPTTAQAERSGPSPRSTAHPDGPSTPRTPVTPSPPALQPAARRPRR